MTNKVKLPILFLFLTEEHGVDAKPYLVKFRSHFFLNRKKWIVNTL
jgi:hypothetical protein